MGIFLFSIFMCLFVSSVSKAESFADFKKGDTISINTEGLYKSKWREKEARWITRESDGIRVLVENGFSFVVDDIALDVIVNQPVGGASTITKDFVYFSHEGKYYSVSCFMTCEHYQKQEKDILAQ